MKCQTFKLNENASVDIYVKNDGELRPFVLIMPGGGYIFTSHREGQPIASRFYQAGFNTGVLWYTAFDKVKKVYQQATLEAAQAIEIIRKNAIKWHINPLAIGVCGFSAGGNLALQIATHFKDEWLSETLNQDNAYFKVDFVIASYPMISTDIFPYFSKAAAQVYVRNPLSVQERILGTENPTQEDYNEFNVLNYITSETPPMFIWHTYEDQLVNVSDALSLAQTCLSHQVPFELHIYEKGAHGLAMADESTASVKSHVNDQAATWFELCVNWLNTKFNNSGD